MRTIAIFILMLAVAVCAAHAEDKNFIPKDRYCVIDKVPQAKEPVGAVIETTGVFVGKITSAVEIAMTGERKITVENETGETKIFPFSQTTSVADKTFNAVTFNKLTKGEKVRVDYTEEGGVAKAEKVIIEGASGAPKTNEPSGTAAVAKK